MNKKTTALFLSAALGLTLLAGCASEKGGSINVGEVNANGYIVVANNPEEVKLLQGDLTPLDSVTNLTFDFESLAYSFTGVEGADFYFIRVFPVVNGVESNSASFQSDKIEATSGNTYSGTIEGEILLAGDYNVYVVASGIGHSSSEAMTTGSSTLLASPSVKANYQKTEGDNPVVTAEITITPGDDLTNSFTLTVTDGTGKVVYTNAKAGTDPIVLTAEDLGVEVLNTEDEFYANVTVNDVSGYIAPTDAVSTQITERRGSGPS